MSGVFTCEICNQNFHKSFLKNRHKRVIHKINSVQKRGRPAGLFLKCDICSWSTSSKRYLIKHMNSEHLENKRKIEINCPVNTCTFWTVSYKELCCHVLENHKTEVHKGACIKEISFNTVEEFKEWKLETERKTNTRYVFSRSPWMKRNMTISQYFCHRSGTCRRRGTGTRLIKRQGSCKINKICPAMMTVSTTESGVIVTFNDIHVGHDFLPKHVPLSKAEREMIAGQLAMNIPIDVVLKNIRDSLDSKEVSRLHILERHDLSNIIRDFRLDGDKNCQHDAESVSIWIQKMKEQGDDTVRFVKFQNNEDNSHGLRDDDFLLVLMTDVQKEMFKEFGANSTICIDSTHGTNAYHFSLTTLLVLDEYNEGFPVAFCYSNRTDYDVLKCFFSALKTSLSVESFCVQTLMSDDSDSFYNAWTDVMGPPNHKLLCSWHVDRSWRKNIPLKVKGGNQELKATIYKNLKLLQHCPDIDDFHVGVYNFLSACYNEDSSREFGRYFEREYANRCNQWAYCYRLGLHVNTNNHLESFHRVLKHVVMKGLKVNRMDKSINAVMAFVHSKVFDRLLKLNKGKLNSTIQGIRKRHKTSKEMSAEDVTAESSSLWKVKSSRKDEFYTVKKNISSNHVTCPLKCFQCNICIHQYTCTCCDYMLHTTLCKHIHLVVRVSGDNQSQPTDAVEEASEDRVGNDILLSAVTDPKTSTAAKLVEIDNLLDKLKAKMLNPDHNTDASVVRYVYHNLSSIVGFLDNKENMKQRQSFPEAEYAPPNKKSEKQVAMYSTRPTRSKNVLTYSMPTEEERLDIEAGLAGTQLYISSNSSNDHSYT